MMALAWAAKGSDLTEAEYAKVLAHQKEIGEAQEKVNVVEKECTVELQAAKGDYGKRLTAHNKFMKVHVELAGREGAFRETLRTFQKQTGLIRSLMTFLAWLRFPPAMAWQQQQEQRRKAERESAARLKWRLFHESKTMDEVSRMTGIQFEEFLVRLFSRMGYRDITLTATNDQGGDLLCLAPSGARAVIQAKRWQGTVGNAAVQELLGAMLYYDRAEGMVVTNSTFSAAARELAKKDSRITLRDGRWLAEQIERFLPPEIPEFDWEGYNRIVKDWQPFRASGTRRSKAPRY
jgi:HJR/Mrr/RecB family endonuclease